VLQDFAALYCTYSIYLCTVHVVTFTLLIDQLMHLFQHFHIHIKTPERLLKTFYNASYIFKTPTCFGPYSRTIFRGRPSLLVHLPRFCCTLPHMSLLVCGRVPSICMCIRYTCLCVVCRQHTGRYTRYKYKQRAYDYIPVQSNDEACSWSVVGIKSEGRPLKMVLE
jgi:hypothetical protein